jgi:hypothetical protein
LNGWAKNTVILKTEPSWLPFNYGNDLPPKRKQKNITDQLKHNIKGEAHNFEWQKD